MKYLVTRVVRFTKTVEAGTKQQALENFGDLGADSYTVSYFARKVKEAKK